MGALAKDATLQSVLESMTGFIPVRTATVKEITFMESQFESGQIDTTTGLNKNGPGFLRTSDYIELPQNVWKAQLLADRPLSVRILYYDSEKAYQEYDINATGYANIKNYPYCRLYYYEDTSYLSNADFITTRLKIQYIENTPAKNEHLLHNHLFNGNFEYDRNNDGTADGWTLRNSPSSSSVSDGVLSVTPSVGDYFLRYSSSDSRLTDHKIYIAFTAYTPVSPCFLSIYNSNITVAQNTQFTRASSIVTALSSSVTPGIGSGAPSIGHEIKIKNVMMIDLTDSFGAGNEPTKEQVEEIIDKWYDGYVPCEYVIKYDDSEMPVDVVTRLKNIDTSSDRLTVTDGEVTSVGHYVGGELKSTLIINRDKFGNLVSVEEV